MASEESPRYFRCCDHCYDEEGNLHPSQELDKHEVPCTEAQFDKEACPVGSEPVV